MRVFFLALICLMVSGLTAKIFVSEYTYNAGEMDSKVTSRTFATEQVKKQVLQEIGMFVSTQVTNVNSETDGILKEMTSSEISVIAAGVVSFTILEETWNGTQYWIKAQVEADPQDVIRALDALVDKKEEVEKLKEAQSRADAALSEAESLRLELKKTKDDLERVRLQASYNTSSNAVAAKEWLQKAYLSVKAEQYDEAMRQYTKATEYDPTLAAAYSGMGNISQYRKQIDLALEYYQKAMDNHSTSEFPYSAAGNLYLERKDYQAALRCFTRLVELAPLSHTAHYDLAITYHRLRDFPSALSQLDQAIRVYTGVYQEAYNFKGQIYLEQQQWDQAITAYQTALLSVYQTDSTRSYLGLGCAYTSKQEYTVALGYLEQAKKLSPYDLMVLTNLSYTHYQNKDYQKCIDHLDYVVRNSPANAELLLLLGSSYSELKNNEQALTYLNRAVAIDPANKYITNGLGWTYYQKNDYNLAIVWYQKSLAIDPEFAEPYYNLGLAYEKQGNPQLSTQNLKQAAKLNHKKAKDKLGIK